MRQATMMHALDDEQWCVPVGEAADMLGVSLSTLARLYARGKGPARRKVVVPDRSGRNQLQVRYSRAALYRFVATYPAPGHPRSTITDSSAGRDAQ